MTLRSRNRGCGTGCGCGPGDRAHWRRSSAESAYRRMWRARRSSASCRPSPPVRRIFARGWLHSGCVRTAAEPQRHHPMTGGASNAASRHISPGVVSVRKRSGRPSPGSSVLAAELRRTRASPAVQQCPDRDPGMCDMHPPDRRYCRAPVCAHEGAPQYRRRRGHPLP